MIDLRKPLDGAAGLLLLAALVLFGATIGISLALAFSWVEMKDSSANFLGGVVGAGLGAALAVLGSVYLYTRGRLDERAPMLVELHSTLDEIIACLQKMRRLSSVRQTTMVEFIAQVTFLGNHAGDLVIGRYLPKQINDAAMALRDRILEVRDAANSYVIAPTETAMPSAGQLDEAVRLAESLLAQVEALE